MTAPIPLRSRLRLLVAALAAFLPLTASAAEPDPVRVSLVSDSGRPGPDGTVRLGVLFSIDPGWHVYWKYPGEIGLPTRVELELPEGASAGELQWPVPEEFGAPGQPAGYGYARETLLWAEVKAPAGSSGPVSVRVKWLGCGERACIPGAVTLDSDLASVKADKDLFTRYSSLLPSAAAERVKASVTGGEGGEPAGQPRRYSVDLEWAPPGASSEIWWIPAPPPGVKIVDIKVEGSARISFGLKVKGNGPVPERLESLVLTKEGGKTVASELALPLPR